MKPGANASPHQEFDKLIAALGSNHVHVINMPRPRPFRRSFDDAFETLVVTRRDLTPMFVQLVEIPYFDSSDRSLDLVEAEIVTDKIVHVFRTTAMIAQHPKFFCKRQIIRRNAATVSHDSEVLGRKK